VTLERQQTARVRDRGRQRRSTGRRLLAWILRLAVLAIVFIAGLAVGKALEQSPDPGGTQTIVRTLEPLTVEPQERTVTVTTSER
jgi:hypothetical protein